MIFNNMIKETIEELKEQIVLLKKKLQEKQDHINKTNAYWKKKFYNKL